MSSKRQVKRLAKRNARVPQHERWARNRRKMRAQANARAEARELELVDKIEDIDVEIETLEQDIAHDEIEKAIHNPFEGKRIDETGHIHNEVTES